MSHDEAVCRHGSLPYVARPGVHQADGLALQPRGLQSRSHNLLGHGLARPGRSQNTAGVPSEHVLHDLLREVIWSPLLVDRPLEGGKGGGHSIYERLELASRIDDLRHKFAPIDFGRRGAGPLVIPRSARRQDRSQVRVGDGLHSLLEASLLSARDSTEDLVDAQAQEVLLLNALPDRDVCPGNLEPFLLKAVLVHRAHGRQP